jgi:D-sedoheptulose 7-phosphate isomerase
MTPLDPQHIIDQLRDSAATQQRISEQCVPHIVRAAQLIVDAYRGRHKVLLCGNGGSAADAQHIAAELVGKLTRRRPALAALALTTNTSILTAVSNDEAFEDVFARQIEALTEAGDVLIALSTSGQSPNVLAAVRAAQARNVQTIALTGKGGGELGLLVDVAIVVPSDNTQRIQEGHITIGHILCDLIEAALFE